MFGGGEIVLPLRLHQRHFWLLLRIPVLGREDVVLVLDSGCFVSAVKTAVLDELVLLGRATWLRGRRFLLHDLAPSGIPIPDMRVRAGGPAERIDADGIIGLDYLGGFRRVCVDIPTLELTLTLPAA
jgi:hypothetical protein